MGNACKPFGYTIDEGMKAFSTAELFMCIFHIIICTMVYGSIETLIDWSRVCKDGLGFVQLMIMLFLIILMATLVLQIIFSILLYFLGYRKRNVTICLIWIIIACVNFTCPWLVLLFEKLRDHKDCGYFFWFWTSCYLYLLYLILGVWIVIAYMKWIKATGIAVEFSVTPAPAPSREKEKTHKTRAHNNDDEDDV